MEGSVAPVQYNTERELLQAFSQHIEELVLADVMRGQAWVASDEVPPWIIPCDYDEESEESE